MTERPAGDAGRMKGYALCLDSLLHGVLEGYSLVEYGMPRLRERRVSAEIAGALELVSLTWNCALKRLLDPCPRDNGNGVLVDHGEEILSAPRIRHGEEAVKEPDLSLLAPFCRHPVDNSADLDSFRTLSERLRELVAVYCGNLAGLVLLA